MEYGGNVIDDDKFFTQLNSAIKIALRDCGARFTDEIKSNAMYAALDALKGYNETLGDTIEHYVFLCAKREAKRTIIRTRHRNRKILIDGQDELRDGKQIGQVNLREIPEPDTPESFDLRTLHPADVVLLTETIRIGVIPIKPGILSMATQHVIVTKKRERLRKLANEYRKSETDDASGD